MSEFQYTPEKIKFLEKDTVDIRQILETVWGLRFWILLSLIVCFGIAYAYCLYKTPVYETACSIMLVNEEGSKGTVTSEMALMSEFTGMSLQQKMSNELYILKTTSLMQYVVEDLDLNIQYFHKDRIKNKEYYKNSPLLFQWENPVPLAASEIQHMEIHLTLQSENESFIINEFLIKGEEVFLGIRNYAFGEIISTSAGLFSINRVPNMTTNHDTFLIIVTSPRAKARQISDRLTVSQISQGRSGLSNSSDIILLSLQEEIPQRSSDILNALIINYINDTRNFKAASVNKSIAFINGRLTEIEKDLGAIDLPKPRIVEIPTIYGGEFGEDLGFVAEHNGLSEDQVIKIHSSIDYRIYMLGFTPGFSYLGGMSEKIAAPRLKTPRTKIPGGSVGIAGKQTGIYPMESPGGWQLIGRTPVKLYDPSSETPIILQAGDYIRFIPIDKDEYDYIHDLAEKKQYKIKIFF